MIEGAPKNPYKEYLELYASWKKTNIATEYRSFGRLSWIEVSEHNKERINDAILDIQTKCLPVIRQLRGQKNIAQLQDKVYLGLLKYANKFNICLVQSRTMEQSDYCSEKFIENITVDFRPQLKQILSEY